MTARADARVYTAASAEQGEVGVVGSFDIVFGWSFDGGAWPGAMAPSLGEAWLGTQGLISRLELELGLAARHALPLERAVGLTRTLGDGYWSASFAVDPIATAQRLLDDRDTLVSWGWSGQRASPRLAALWEATSHARPGIPDRVRRVIDYLERGRVAVATIALADPIASYPPIWQTLFSALERCGVRVVSRVVPSCTSSGDLGGARTSGFVPRGDGSLQLLRTYGAIAAADEIASLLAAATTNSATLIIGADAVLDAALARQGMPRTGADAPTPASAALLRACIESAFHPTDAADLHALITADPGPVPRNIAWGLAGALRRFAGRGSDEWRDALAGQLAVLEPVGRESVAARLKSLLEPLAPREGVIAMPVLEARIKTLAAWARARDLTELGTRSDQLIRLFEGEQHASRAQLLRMCDALERSTVAGIPSEVGLHSVIAPGSMVGPAHTVIWWGFTRDRAPVLPRIKLTNVERAALGGAAPDVGAVMTREALLWRRPLELATGTLVLVCPHTDAVGDQAQPHPLWDEIVAAMPDAVTQARLEVERPLLQDGVRARRERAVSRPLPQPFEVACTPAPIALREEESASSLEQLLGCSLAHTLRYRSKLRPRLAAPPVEPGPLLYGNIAHHILAAVFATGVSNPDEAAARADGLLDAELPRVAETLLLPDHQAERATLRRAVVAGARLVAKLIESTGGRLRGVEVPLAGQIGTTQVAARADLVLDAPEHVIDFKWGTSSQRESLRAGAAVQLAIYAALMRAGGKAAFVSVRDQRVLAPRGSAIPMASEPGAHTLEAMLAGVGAALADRIAALSRRELVAPGAVEDSPRSGLVDGVLYLAPKCDYCELGTLCGRRGRA